MNNKTHDEIIQLVNEELRQTETVTFSTFRLLDKKLRSPTGTALDASGWKGDANSYRTTSSNPSISDETFKSVNGSRFPASGENLNFVYPVSI